MGQLTDRVLRFLYSRYVPRPVRNPLRLHLELLRREAVPEIVRAPEASRVLVLAPHMDDEVFGCGGTLTACAAGGSEVVVTYLTDGSKGYIQDSVSRLRDSEIRSLEAELVATRKEEARRAGKILGLSEPIFLDLPDGALALTPEAVGRLAGVLHRVTPDVVYLPFLTDLHPDHWMTNCLFVEAARVAGLDPAVRCWGYEVWVPLVANTLVDITGVIEAKLRAMQEFASQTSDVDYPRAIIGLNAYRSILSGQGHGFAEAFYLADFALYRGLYETVAIGRRGR